PRAGRSATGSAGRYRSGAAASFSAAAGSRPAPTRIEELAHGLHREQSAREHVVERRAAAEDRVAVGKLHPLVGELVAVEDVQRLVDADEVGDARDAVDLEDALRILLP